MIYTVLFMTILDHLFSLKNLIFSIYDIIVYSDIS